MVQESSAELAWRSPAIAGSATFTTEPSMNARLDPRIVATSVARGCAELPESVVTAMAVSQGPVTAPDIGLIPYPQWEPWAHGRHYRP